MTQNTTDNPELDNMVSDVKQITTEVMDLQEKMKNIRKTLSEFVECIQRQDVADKH